MATILIFEPDVNLAQKLCDSLEKEKRVAVICDENDPSIVEKYADETPVVILDARLKWTACRPLLTCFSQRGCPILFLTADRSMSTHLRALYAGRCEVLTVPFAPRALQNRLTALTGPNEPPREISVDEKERVALLGGRRVELTAQEFALLLALLERPDTPVSREQLLRTAWGYQSMGETRTVDVHVQRLRKKLGGEYIETVYKCGYRLKLA